MKLFHTSFSALDRYFGLNTGAYLDVLTEGSLVDAAKGWDELQYPGIDGVDVLVEEPGRSLLVQCDAHPGSLASPVPTALFPLLRLVYEPEINRFIDYEDIYPLMRDPDTKIDLTDLKEAEGWGDFLTMAILVSRYHFKWSKENLPSGEDFWGILPPLEQQIGLIRILEGKNPQEGLELLKDCGFLKVHWPELYAMIPVTQGKEHHPEGNVWEHTLGTFYHRKGRDIRVSLGLLLHDIGKPLAEEEDGRRFNQHAQLGRQAAYKFLRRLDFSSKIIEDVGFLVGQHMIPGLSRTLPPGRVRGVLSSPLYPLLLEVYRCDLSSTFRGPDGYYEACKVYRGFLKNSRNPFRGEDGKKTLRLYVES